MRIFLIAALTLACVSTLTAQDQSGSIVFYREPHSMTGYFKPTLYCDRQELAQIENGTYFEVTAPAGTHTCSAQSLENPIDVNVTAGGTTYVHVKLLQGWHDRAELVFTSGDEYAKEQRRLKALREWDRNSLGPRSESAAVRAIPQNENPSPTAMPQSSQRSSKQKHDKTYTSCLIVNARPARADESAWVALSGKDPTDFRYDYIDSLHLPSDHFLVFKKTDLDKLESKGTRVIVLDRSYTAEHLAAARETCKAIDADLETR